VKCLYNITIRIYYLLIVIASSFNAKARLWLKGRKGLLESLGEKINRKNKLFWIHAASLGEFEQGRPLIEALKEKYPDDIILLTFFSPSGFEIRKDYKGADIIIYLPFDFSRNAKKFLDIVKPDKAIFIKYEFWYNYIFELHRRKIPVILISAIFRKNQIFFKWYGSWFRKALSFYKFIFVQNQDSQALLESIGISNSIVSGDTRFDRVVKIKEQKNEIDLLRKFKDGKKILIAGSTWDKDENLIIEYINNTSNDIKFIIAPHEVNESHISEILNKIKTNKIKYSEAGATELGDCNVLIIDNIGQLSSMYSYAEVSYIGGGFGVGIHNILEPASFGLPVLFGPNYKKFSEAKILVEKGGALPVNNFKEFEVIVNAFLNNSIELNKASKICSEFVNENIGASEMIMEKLINSCQ